MSKNAELNIKEWLANVGIPLVLNLKSKKSIFISTEETENEKQHWLNFPVYNGNRLRNTLMVPITPDGVLDCIYNQNSDLEEVNTYPHIFQSEESSPEGWGLETLEGNKDLFITLSPLDRLAWNCLGEENVLALPTNWQNDDRYISEISQKINLNTIPNIYISFPEIESKTELEEIISSQLERLGPNLKFVNLDVIDENINTLFEFIPRLVQEKLNPEDISTRLKAYSRKENIAGIVTLDTVETLVDSIYMHGVKQGESTGWDTVDQLYRPKLGYVSLVYGIPSHGKSTFVKGLALNLAHLAHWKSLFFASEDGQAERFYHEMIEKNLGVSTPFYTPNSDRNSAIIKQPNYIQSKNFVKDNIFLLKPTPQHYLSEDFFEALMDTIKVAIKTCNIKQVILDPWNQIIENRKEGQTEANYLCEKLAYLNRFAQEHNVHIIVVAHPRIMPREEKGEYKLPTPYDLSGGAHWYNQTAACICIYRHEIPTSTNLHRITHVVVQKIKDRALGSLGTTFLYTLPNSETLRGDNFDVQGYKIYLKQKKENQQTNKNLNSFLITAKNRIVKPDKKEISSLNDLPF